MALGRGRIAVSYNKMWRPVRGRHAGRPRIADSRQGSMAGRSGVDRDPFGPRATLLGLGRRHGQDPVAELGLDPVFVDVAEHEPALEPAVDAFAEGAAAVF